MLKGERGGLQGDALRLAGQRGTTKEATGFLSGKLQAFTFHQEASDGLLLMLHLPQNQ